MTEQRDSVTAAELDEFNAAYTRQCAREDIEICANGGPCGCAQAAFLSASATLRRELDEAREKELGLKTVLNQAYLYLREHTPADAVSTMWANEIISAMEAIAKKVTSHD